MRSPSQVRVAIGLGSNLGDRLGHLRFGYEALQHHVGGLTPSAVYESDPLHFEDQPSFLNACCVGRTRLTPRQLLAQMQHIEGLASRRRDGVRYGPRTLDLDLLLYGERRVEEVDLVVPHPRLHERAFALVPLREIAADWRVPGGRGRPERTVAELTDAVDVAGVERTSERLEDR